MRHTNRSPAKVKSSYREEANYIVRIQKHERDYVVITNAALEDRRLTFAGKGLLAYLLTKPRNWIVRVNHLTTVGKDGWRKVTAIMSELKSNGYASLDTLRGEDGRLLGKRWTIYEEPQDHPVKTGLPPKTPKTENRFYRESANGELPSTDKNSNYSGLGKKKKPPAEITATGKSTAAATISSTGKNRCETTVDSESDDIQAPGQGAAASYCVSFTQEDFEIEYTEFCTWLKAKGYDDQDRLRYFAQKWLDRLKSSGGNFEVKTDWRDAFRTYVMKCINNDLRRLGKATIRQALRGENC